MVSGNERFRMVCRGVLKGIRKHTFVYKSILLHRKDPYLILGPFRIEILSSTPIKLLVHDFFNDFEAEWLKYYASVVFYTPARIIHPETFGNVSVSSQSNAVELHMDGPHVNSSAGIRIAKVHDRISLATRLSSIPPFGSEPLRVSLYGMAGNNTVLYYNIR